MSNFLGSIFGVGGNFATSAYNNWYAEKAQARARQENFTYNEMAAKNANERWRQNYLDFFTPSAQLQMIKEAGLSPSLMMSGGAGGGGTPPAPQGLGAQGLQNNFYPASALEAAQIGLIKAQTNNTNQNTIATEIENGIKKLEASSFKNKWNLVNSTYFGNEKGVLSWSDLINNSENYNNFQTKVSDILKNTESPEALFIKTEEGQNTLRQIYNANKTFSNDIAVLANSEENAKLMLEITKLLNNSEYVNSNANAQIKQLQQVAESAELTTEQKGAMNRLIDKMGQNTTSDVILVLLMMLGSYSHANLNFGVSQTNQIKK